MTVLPGETVTETVTFTPTSAGPSSGNWAINGSRPPVIAVHTEVPRAPKVVPDVATARTIARTYITYTALARATTHFTLEREIVGRRGSHGCVRRTAHNEHAGRCTLLVIVATFTHFDHVGRNQVRVTAPPATLTLAAATRADLSVALAL